MNQEKIKQIADKIIAWEHDAGESFTDYFMHGSVRDVSWAFWLVGKGFTERGNEILNLVNSGETCLDQELLYDIHPSYEYTEKTETWNQDNYNKNVLLWAEFLISTDIYKKRFEDFLVE